MLTNDDFYKHKNTKNNELHKTLTQRFQKIISKFQTLSKVNSYKKINKVSLINVNKNDSILNILNKLTNDNFDTLSEKIIMKLDNSNICCYINQIVNYCSKSEIDSKYFYNLLITIKESKFNTYDTQNQLDLILTDYIHKFIQQFDLLVSISKNETYSDFLRRTSDNKNVINSIKLINYLVSDTVLILNKTVSITVLFNLLVDKLSNAITIPDNVNCIFLILDCLHVYVKEHESLKSNPWEYTKFINMFSKEEKILSLGFKMRFKLLDICELMQK
jgi:hypothetical protein